MVIHSFSHNLDLLSVKTGYLSTYFWKFQKLTTFDIKNGCLTHYWNMSLDSTTTFNRERSGVVFTTKTICYNVSFLYSGHVQTPIAILLHWQMPQSLEDNITRKISTPLEPFKRQMLPHLSWFTSGSGNHMIH